MALILVNGIEFEVDDFPGLDELLAEWRRGITPAANFLVSEWADERRILDKPFTKARTRWHTSKVPYTEEIMDCFSPQSPVQRVYWMKSAQVSGSETGNNIVGHSIEVAPGMLMYVNPTKSMIKRMSARIQALIDTSPTLKELVLPARSRDSGNTQFMKKFPGGLIVFVGAQSATDLRSYACQIIILDEMDAFPEDVDGEGPPDEVVEARTNAQGENYKIYGNSTPKIEQSSVIYKKFKGGDQRYYFMRCPHSRRLIKFEFKQLYLQVENRPETVRYRCDCGCENDIQEGIHKTAMMAKGSGVWVPRVIWSDAEAMAKLEAGDRSQLDELNRTTLYRSYAINALYSPIGWMSWKRIMTEYAEALGNPASMKKFWNTVLGLPWREIGEAPDPEVIYNRRSRVYRQREIPEGVLFLTAGADVGQDHIEVSIYGWGRRRQRYLIEHVRIDGPYNEKSTWDRLDDLLERRYEHPSGAIMAIRRLCIDRGKWTDTIDAWVSGKDRGRVTAIKGYDHLDTVFRWAGAKKQHKDGTQSQKTYAIKWALAGVSYLKLELMGLLNLKREGEDDTPAGWIHLPSDVTLGWIKQLASERLEYKTVKNGRRRAVWEENGTDRHEALDCTNYARVAAAIEGWDDWSEIEIRREEDHIAEAAEDRRVRLYEWQQRNGGTGAIDEAVPGLVRPIVAPDFGNPDKGIMALNTPAVSAPASGALIAGALPAATSSAQIGIVGCKPPVRSIPLPTFGSFHGDGDE